jgi:hypothetical protein
MAEALRGQRAEGVRNVRLKLLLLACCACCPAWGGAHGLERPGLVAAGAVPGDEPDQPVAVLAGQTAGAPGLAHTEKVLHASELLGGWPGALLAQQLFRHKTRKVSYQLVSWGLCCCTRCSGPTGCFLKGAICPLLEVYLYRPLRGYRSDHMTSPTCNRLGRRRTTNWCERCNKSHSSSRPMG